ncbi:hypothetical protein T459_01487 [Capsicum annuum]|uniref:HMA domain-containing protein n=1 Tax=Capsicum annuum TaxID=4072 RepID=A0A2G3AH82_CAPAN|nr:hypothetical protein T459_01487 [Capsicum annuum]
MLFGPIKVTALRTEFSPYPGSNPRPLVKGGAASFTALQPMSVCMVMRVNLDCPSCCRKMRKIILRRKEIEMHLIEKQHNRVSIFGRFDPADTAIRIRKKMNRRVEILDVRLPENGDGQAEEMHHAPGGTD